MNKETIVSKIIEVLRIELKQATAAAQESADDATDEEARPENKYDTRGLETSYLASAQAHYAKELKEALQAYHNLTLPNASEIDSVRIGAKVTTLSSNGREIFFVGPARGGLEIGTEDGSIMIITPKSPIGKALLGKRMGEHGQANTRYTILRVE